MRGSDLSADVNPGGEEQSPETPFADPNSRKFPLDTEEHIRAAWTLVSDTENPALSYDAGEREALKERIRQAAADRAIALDSGTPARHQADDGHRDNPLDPHSDIGSGIRSEPLDRRDT